MDASGRVVMAGGEAAPSILAGVSLTILSSEGVTISSHLISQGSAGRTESPMSRTAAPRSSSIRPGRTFWRGQPRKAGSPSPRAAPDNLTLQASLVAGGTGFAFKGKGKAIEVLGGIQAVDYTSEGNTLRISPDRKLAEGRSLPGNAPLSTGTDALRFFLQGPRMEGILNENERDDTHRGGYGPGSRLASHLCRVAVVSGLAPRYQLQRAVWEVRARLNQARIRSVWERDSHPRQAQFRRHSAGSIR